MKISIPDYVKRIIDILEGAGYEAYAVGGCVRDTILGRCPDDWDITTSARPAEIKALFRRTVDTGIEHGTVTVLMGRHACEVTTYRIDGEYKDSRHPESVTFTGLLSEDLERRDFTINAMAYNDREGIVDLHGGQADLENKVIRAVGDPAERFNEDALRIMRAVRFAAQLGFEIEDGTKEAASSLAENLRNISAERIRTELVKLIVSPNPDMLRMAYDMGITGVILPEFDLAMETPQNNPHHMYSVGEHTLHAMSNISSDGYDEQTLTVLRLSMLFHDLGKPACKVTGRDGVDHFKGHPSAGKDIAFSVMRRLKFDNKTRDAVLSIVLYHDLRPEPTLPGVRKAVNLVGESTAELLADVQTADIMAQSEYKRSEKLEKLAMTKKNYELIKANHDPLFVRDLRIGGNDLISAGLAQGQLIGEVLNHLTGLVLEDPSLNERDSLLQLAKQYVSDHHEP